ncbi:hypothetical protein ACP4OV_023010 [Aristida adscensionis]
MRQLIRQLARVGDCSSSPRASSPAARRRGCGGGAKRAAAAGVPEGHVPVYVVGSVEGEEEARFVVRAEVLGAPAMAELLDRAAQEYGYHHQGPLRVPCAAAVFRRALAAACDGDEDEDGETPQ